MLSSNDARRRVDDALSQLGLGDDALSPSIIAAALESAGGAARFNAAAAASSVMSSPALNFGSLNSANASLNTNDLRAALNARAVLAANSRAASHPPSLSTLWFASKSVPQQPPSGLDLLRNSPLLNEVSNPTLLAALCDREALQNALNARTALDLMQAKSPTSAPTLTIPPTAAPSAPDETAIQDAYQRGKEEAILSMVRSGLIKASALSQIESLGVSAEQQQPSKTNAEALEALGVSSIARRKHNAPYFDASSLADPDPVTLANRRSRGGVNEPFPEKLHRMLQECQEKDESDVISFFAHGRAFKIYHVERFTREIMPRYFKQSRLSSFQRQLNLYGFTRITVGPDAGGYYHELFLKGRPALAIHMRRVGVPKPNGTSRILKANSNSTSPDFYSMIPINNRNNNEDEDTKQPAAKK